MCISKDQLQNKVKDLRQLKRMQEELKAEIEAIQGEITEYMETENTDIITGLDYKITWKLYTSNRLDSTALKKDLPDLFSKYAKETSYRKFILS